MMMRLLAMLLSFFPIVVFADSTGNSLSFAPPASDYSVVFLGNLFGVVDGVLHGAGSQMMGTIFSVFNAAVLALGGIIIMYTLIVSTMNTAHEGQMLGQKWSSIWIPLRSTFGLALLIPKASGYCLMQIFVMWVVVQGVGAADKVWEAALGYLNRGGTIVQAQSFDNTTSDLLSRINGTGNAIPQGAFAILTGQVCMLGIQKQLEKQRQLDIAPNGRCSNKSGISLPPTCQGPVPDLLATVNFVTFEQNQMEADQQTAQADKNSNQKFTPPVRKMDLPNFTSSGADTTSPYAALDGICGQVGWNAVSLFPPGTDQSTDFTAGYSTTTGSTTDTNGISLTASQLQTALLSRAIAVQQMYVDLSAVAQVIIGNDPTMNTNDSSPPSTFLSNAALQGFGVPYTSAGGICASYDKNCTTWGPDSTSLTSANSDNSTSGGNSGALFNGTEFMGSILDYNGIMKATLNLQNAIAGGKQASSLRAFIDQANAQGWMMAGAYYYNLIQINGNSLSAAQLSDTNSGLDASTALKINDLTGNAILNTWFPSTDPISNIENIIDGKYLETNLLPISQINTSGLQAPGPPSLADDSTRAVVSGLKSSTVYGFVNNSLMVQVAGQPGIAPLQFANIMSFSPDTKMYYLQQQSFSCGYVKTFIFSFCLGALLGDIFYNGIIYTIYNALIFFFQQIIQQVMMAFIMIPLQGMSQIFKDGLDLISQPGADPIQSLAQMGVAYINFSGNLWIQLLMMAVTSALIPLLGIFVFAMLAFVMPLLMSWLGIMLSVGFTTAYYIPLLPYLIFTFGSVAWLISVIEAMVAAPIVALGVTHPEGHDAFGKGEAAIMLLMNVFLRPAMMIIGYISAIALSYVSIWILNAGFDTAIMYIQGGNSRGIGPAGMDIQIWGKGDVSATGNTDNSWSAGGMGPETGSGSGGYTGWAGIYAYFFSILMYTSLYLTLVQKAFTLISYLPDKVLRWIGGSPDSIGSESAQWGDEHVKGQHSAAAKESSGTLGQMSKQLEGKSSQATGKLAKQLLKSSQNASVNASSDDSGGGEASPGIAGGK